MTGCHEMCASCVVGVKKVRGHGVMWLSCPVGLCKCYLDPNISFVTIRS